jgi:toxin FitB
MKYLLDTNIISELIARQPDERVVAWVDAQDPASIYLSVITIGEIQKGIVKLPASKRKETLAAWLRDDLLARFSGRILTITSDVMLRWGELTGMLEQAGKPLPAIVSLIAAITLQGGYALVTRNEDDFKDTGVILINPWK